LQEPSLFNPVWCIQPQKLNRHHGNPSERPDEGTVQLEVLGPPISARAEEPDQLTSCRIDGSDVTSLIAVADDAGVGEVVSSRAALVLPADDVVDLMLVADVVFVNEAVFAGVPRTSATCLRSSSLISDATGKHQASLGLCHPEDVLQFDEVVKL
jgi:hypothetical protein